MEEFSKPPNRQMYHFECCYSFANADAYALINFEAEGCTAMVPLARVAPLSDSCEVITGKECDVLWSSRRHFRGILLLIGMQCNLARHKYVMSGFLNSLSCWVCHLGYVCAC